MSLNEIKKSLYKEKPKADFVRIKKGKAYYAAVINQSQYIGFEVPVEDMGDAEFCDTMDAQLLIRWIMADEINPSH
jgi:hypothetical protein